MNSKKFTHLDGEGKPWAVVSTEQLWANVYAMKYNKPEIRLGFEHWLVLFHQAKAAAVEFGADVLITRLRKDYEAEMLADILSQLGLKKTSERAEYDREVSALPSEKGTPLQWQTAKELGWDIKQLAQFLDQVAKDAIDIDPEEKSEDFAQDWLTNSELTSGPDCIAIGFIGANPCALAVAQVQKNNGWSRISYMGLIPEYRRQGLGRWVHRHGFTMMKEQGGKLYCGGTHADNIAMRKLFEAHDCRFVFTMEEWSLNLKGGV